MDRKSNLGTEVNDFLLESFRIVGRYFKSRLLISLILGVICYFVLWIVGARLKLLISIIVAITTLVPYIGPLVAMIVTAVIVVFQEPIYALWVTVMNLGLQVLDGWVLSPLILGKSLGVRPIVVIISILIGGSVFGVIGIIIAVPTAAIIGLLIRKIRNRNREE